MSDLEYRVSARIGTQTYRTDITAGGHSLLADEPIAEGGTDQGPTPYDLIVAALGACTAMTMRMYADRKGWPVEEIIVHLRHGRNHAADDRVCENAPARLDFVERRVELRGELTNEQRRALIEIADRCPVHQTLDAGLRIETLSTTPAS